MIIVVDDNIGYIDVVYVEEDDVVFKFFINEGSFKNIECVGD